MQSTNQQRGGHVLARNTCPSCRWFGFRVALLVSIPFLTLTFHLLLVGYVSRPSSGLEWHLHGWANRAIALTISMWPWTCRRAGWRVQLSQCRVVGCALTQSTSSHTSTTPSTAPQCRCAQEHTHAPQAFTHAPLWPLCRCPCRLGYTSAVLPVYSSTAIPWLGFMVSQLFISSH